MGNPPTYTTRYSGFPYYCYDYTAAGEHTGEQSIDDAVELMLVFEELIPKAMRSKRKFVIINSLGECLFLAEEGKVIFPTRKNLKVRNGKWIINHERS